MVYFYLADRVFQPVGACRRNYDRRLFFYQEEKVAVK